LVFYELPNDSCHFITIDLNDGVSNFNFGHDFVFGGANIQRDKQKT
jgi:hypothetical protein